MVSSYTTPAHAQHCKKWSLAYLHQTRNPYHEAPDAQFVCRCYFQSSVVGDVTEDCRVFFMHFMLQHSGGPALYSHFRLIADWGRSSRVETSCGNISTLWQCHNYLLSTTHSTSSVHPQRLHTYVIDLIYLFIMDVIETMQEEEVHILLIKQWS